MRNPRDPHERAENARKETTQRDRLLSDDILMAADEDFFAEISPEDHGAVCDDS